MKGIICWAVLVSGLVIAGAMAFGETSYRNIEAPLAQAVFVIQKGE